MEPQRKTKHDPLVQNFLKMNYVIETMVNTYSMPTNDAEENFGKLVAIKLKNKPEKLMKFVSKYVINLLLC